MTPSGGQWTLVLGIVFSLALQGCSGEDEPNRAEPGSFGCEMTAESNIEYAVPKTVTQARREGFAATARDAALEFLAESNDQVLDLGPSVRQSYVSVVEEFAVLGEDDRTVKVVVVEKLMRGVWVVTSVQNCAH
jgi:hypothetical protein